MIGGIDEAGRGPVVGPMVMVLVAVEDEGPLLELGVKDSKKLSPSRREELYQRILELADVVVVRRIEPFMIDKYVEVGGLNRLEALVAAELIGKLPLERVYVDAPDVDPERYARTIRSFLGRDIEIVAEHGADSKYPVVSAASIVAKVERDRIIRRMEEVYGKIGTGYPHDEETVSFVKRWMKIFRRTPSFVRGSWNTARRIGRKIFQKRLDDYLW